MILKHRLLATRAEWCHYYSRSHDINLLDFESCDLEVRLKKEESIAKRNKTVISTQKYYCFYLFIISNQHSVAIGPCLTYVIVTPSRTRTARRGCKNSRGGHEVE